MTIFNFKSKKGHPLPVEGNEVKNMSQETYAVGPSLGIDGEVLTSLKLFSNGPITTITMGREATLGMIKLLMACANIICDDLEEDNEERT